MPCTHRPILNVLPLPHTPFQQDVDETLISCCCSFSRCVLAEGNFSLAAPRLLGSLYPTEKLPFTRASH